MLVSFIIPAYNAEKTIKKCLESVLKQKTDKEILVIDNNSKDKTAEIIKKFGKKVKYLSEKKQGEPCARNKGLDNAKGELIAFVDSDVVLPKDWVTKALRVLKKDVGVGGVGGLGRSVDKGLISRIVGSRIYGLDESSKRQYVDSIATMNLLLRKKAIGKARYDESMVLGVDTEFNLRLRKRGFKLLFDPLLFVYHYHPASLSGLLKKWYTYGKNYPYMCTKHKEMRSGGFIARTLFMPLFIVCLLLSILNPLFVLVPVIQVLSLFIFYSYIGIRIMKGSDALLAFPFVQTMKQLAQLFGTMVGLKRLF